MIELDHNGCSNEGDVVSRTLLVNSLMVVVVCGLVLGSATPARYNVYLPLDPGITWSYTLDVEAEVGSPDTINGTTATPLTFEWPAGFDTIPFGLQFWLQEDDEGPLLVDVVAFDGSFDGEQWHLEPWSLGLEASVRLYSYPLVAGTESVDVIGSPHGDLTVVRTIGVEARMTTPYGEFLVFPVTLQVLGSVTLTAEFFLNELMGPVAYGDARMISFGGMIPNEPTSWSDVKATFE